MGLYVGVEFRTSGFESNGIQSLGVASRRTEVSTLDGPQSLLNNAWHPSTILQSVSQPKISSITLFAVHCWSAVARRTCPLSGLNSNTHKGKRTKSTTAALHARDTTHPKQIPLSKIRPVLFAPQITPSYKR